MSRVYKVTVDVSFLTYSATMALVYDTLMGSLIKGLSPSYLNLKSFRFKKFNSETLLCRVRLYTKKTCTILNLCTSLNGSD